MKKKSVCFGRIAEHLATLSDEQKQRTAIMPGMGVFDDFTVQTWNCRAAMAKTIRLQEKAGSGRKWKAVVALSVGEGF